MNSSASNPQSEISKINIGGTGISDITLSETMDVFDEWILQKNKTRVCVTPVNCVVWANQNPQLKEIYNSFRFNAFAMVCH